MKLLEAFVDAWYGDSMISDPGRLPDYAGTIDPDTLTEHWQLLSDARLYAPLGITHPHAWGWTRVLTWAGQTTVQPRGNP